MKSILLAATLSFLIACDHNNNGKPDTRDQGYDNAGTVTDNNTMTDSTGYNSGSPSQENQGHMSADSTNTGGSSSGRSSDEDSTNRRR